MSAGFNFNLRTWTAPHWLTVLGGAAAGGAILSVETALEAGRFPTTAADLVVLLKGAAIAGVVTALGVAKQMHLAKTQETLNQLAKGQLE